MTRKFLPVFLLALFGVLALRSVAQAGPPLICHPYDIGNARSLPWSGSLWRDVKRDYPLSHLVDDTLALLTKDTPVIVRMETLRRAAVYAAWAVYDKEVGYHTPDLKVAQTLMARLQQRAEASQPQDALALFDAGYFIETWKHATGKADHHKLPNVNGYEWVKRASALRHQDASMEFAAALIRFDDKAAQRVHLQKAVTGADSNMLLARNLLLHFSDRGRDLAALRASLR